jgi:hypothetical protein
MIKSFKYYIVVAIMMLISPHFGWAESSQLNEYEVKAAYLYNFAKFVEWPVAVLPREDTPLNVCIAGKSPINDTIDSLAGKTVKYHRLVIRHLSRADDLSECQILFVNASQKISLPQILAAAASRTILTVSDSKGFSAAGGIIEFVQVGDKIRFEINKRASRQVKLQISSHLLRLATNVIE